MRLHRLLGIIMLLDSRGTMKAGALARILETSERSIYRDIDILCEAGIPIMSIPGPTGGYSFMEGYRTNANLLEGTGIVKDLPSNPRKAQKPATAVMFLE
jgi:predicted DNA-binding transcriptional regulator YafY